MQPCTVSDKLCISSVEQTSTIYYINIFQIFQISSTDFYLFGLSGLQIYMVAEFLHILQKIPWSFFKEILRLLCLNLPSVFSFYDTDILEMYWRNLGLPLIFNVSHPEALFCEQGNTDLPKIFRFPGLGNRDVIVMVVFLHKTFSYPNVSVIEIFETPAKHISYFPNNFSKLLQD